tara:strand:+ start:207 stop:1010 length:804 start_codon:yes stop_codon:yes gene_type:complete
MARDRITVAQIVNDFVLTSDGDDFVAGVSNTVIRNFALRGIREMGFDMLKRVRSLKLSVGANNTVELPEDFVDYIKIGTTGSDGLVYVFGENKNINYSQKYSVDAAGNKIDSDGDGVYDRVDDKTALTTSTTGEESYVFRNYLHDTTEGRLYGAGGGQYSGEFRINYDQNRIEIGTGQSVSNIVIEYIADEARSMNPSIHIYADSALRAYVYYKLIERKSTVPMNEKMRARTEYYNERRIANARLKSFTKEEAFKTIRKNFTQAPKY